MQQFLKDKRVLAEFINNHRQWFILATVCSISFLAGLDFTSVNLALVNIGHYFHAPLQQIAWVNNTYLLANALFIMLGGYLSDRYGRKRLFIIGSIGFLFSSLFAASSYSLLQLNIARFLQGLSAAVIIPAAIGNLIAVFPNHKKGFAMGCFSGAAGLSMALGPTLGGMLIEHYSWQAIFYLNVPICLLGTIVASIVFVESKSTSVQPFFDKSFLQNKHFLGAAANRLIINYIFYAMMFVLGLYLQNVLKLSPVSAGLTFLFITVTYGVMCPLGGTLTARFNHRHYLIAGLSLFAVSMLILAVTKNLSSIKFAIPLVMFGMAMSVLWPTTSISALLSIPKSKTSLATGIMYMLSYIGGAIGVFVSTWMLGHTYSYSSLFFSYAALCILAIAIVSRTISPRPGGQEQWT